MGVPHPTKTPCVLIIRDGWGENPHPSHDAFNAVKLARTPCDDALARDWPRTLLRTSGEDVGLPIGPDGPVMGNSEVGHQNIGAGRIVDQELMRLTNAVRSGEFGKNPTLRAAFAHAAATGGRVHLLGLVSDGQVHSDLPHLLALIDLAKLEGIDAARLFVHAITDGRDTAPFSSLRYFEELEAHLRRTGVGHIASVIGRFYAMDRDHRWERVRAAYDCLVGRFADAPRVASSAKEAANAYHADPSDASRGGDEFIVPTVIGSADASGAPSCSRVRSGDSVVFFNFRGDRPREITKAFVLDDDSWSKVHGGGFDRGARLTNLYFATMTEYEEGLPVHIVFRKPPKLEMILGETLAHSGLAQYRCAETEKFPHVTYFFNDYREAPFPRESRCIVPSPKEVSTYDQKPEMSAMGVRDAVLARLAAVDCEAVIVVNFANGDMVGHTGNLAATIRAVETVDQCVDAILHATLARGGSLIITADHGNAEQMWDPAHACPHTAHTNYLVPCSIVGRGLEGRKVRLDGRLADLAPTVLALIGVEKPLAMTGKTLLL